MRYDIEALPAVVRSKIRVDEPTGCWVWTASTWKGYGRIRIAGTEVKAHRFTYHTLADPTLTISGDYRTDTLDHVAERCATGPGCVNPAHLDRVTHRENVARGRRSARSETLSPYHGVTFARDGGRWQCQIQVDGHCVYFGRSLNEQTVAHMADAAYTAIGEPPLNFKAGLVDRPPTVFEVEQARQKLDRLRAKWSAVDSDPTPAFGIVRPRSVA